MEQFNFTTDIVIGLEVHTELKTNTKMFCGCKRAGGENEEPNTRVCPICLGHPGSKPVLNKTALDMGIKLSLALGCKIAPELIFSRKSYFYPDLAKNYQISQFELPLGEHGKVELPSGGKVGITRVHLEEDPASLVHPAGMHDSNHVLIDYNRSGDPLAEIVSEPDLKSPEEAREFMKTLITILNYLDIFDVNTCIIKADANISIKESGYVRSEIKNITGFKEIERALNYELKRQKEAFAKGEKFIQQTRLWDADKGITRLMRTKETADDYGYIIDPDLVKIDLSNDMIKNIKESLPELPHEKIQKFVKQHKIKEEDARIISQEKILAEMFEEVAKKINPILAAKWLRRELVRVINYNELSYDQLEIDESHMIDLLTLVEKKTITDKVAQKLLEKLIIKPFDVKEHVKKEGLEQIQDTGAIEQFVKEAMDENPKAVEDIKAGNEKSVNFIVGQVMRKSKGKASPAEVNKIIKKLLN